MGLKYQGKPLISRPTGKDSAWLAHKAVVNAQPADL